LKMRNQAGDALLADKQNGGHTHPKSGTHRHNDVYIVAPQLKIPSHQKKKSLHL
jgi:hypothetical protein